MDTSLFLAKVIGLCALIIGIALFLSKARFHAVFKDLADHPALILLIGVINLILGVLIVVSHNIWEASWIVLITLTGWFTFFRGVVALVFPNFVQRKLSCITDSLTPIYIAGSINLILGFVLCYFGFMLG